MGRRIWAVVVTAALIVAGNSVLPVSAAMAAPGDLVHGTVIVDSNENGVIDAGPLGENDTPIAGVKVTLRGTNPNHAGWEVKTAADGTWAFPKDADRAVSPGPFTVTIDATGINGNNYLVPATAKPGINDFTRVSGEVQQAVSASIPADASDQALNALVYPTMRTDVIPAQDDTGMGGNAIWTGTSPFDSGDAEPGTDSGPSNKRVRTSDVINHSWSVTVDAENDLASNATIWLEQELKLQPGAVATFGAMPASCADGSKIIASPSEQVLTPRQTPPAGTTSVKLLCDLGLMGDAANANLVDTQVFVSAESRNGATFTTSVRTYGVTETGVTTAQPDGPHEFGPFEITSAPRYDLEKTGKGGGFTYGGFSFRDINGKQVLGKNIYYNVLISTDRKVGVEAFKQPVHFEEALWAQFKGANQNGADGTVNAGLEWYMIGCAPYTGDARQDQGKTVYGKDGMKLAVGSGTSTTENSVRDSGTCSYKRQNANDLTSNYDVTLTGIDASGASYPSKSVSGSDIAADKYYVASYELVVFVPRAEIDKMTGAANDGVGVGAIWNRVGDFDPSGASEASNFGSGFEPGYCAPGKNTEANTKCATMPAGGQSNNIAGPVEIKTSPGTWSKGFTDLQQHWGFRAGNLPSASGHNGAGQVQPGQTFTSKVAVSPETDSPNLQICDVFDNTVLRLSPLGKDATVQKEQYGGAYSQMAYVRPSVQEIVPGDMPAFQQNFDIKYGHIDLSGDNPNTGAFNAGDNRYEGDWSKQRAAASGSGVACGNSQTEFFGDPADVPGGIDAVNVVWARAANGYVQPATSSVQLLTGMEQRNLYNGGPHDGKEISEGTISANFANVKSDTMGAWGTNRYVPGAGNTGGSRNSGESGETTGDRWSLVRAELAVKKWTVEGKVNGIAAAGVAADGVTGSAKAGTPVIWYVKPTLTAASDDPAPVGNVTITDVLPAGIEYDGAATADIAGNTAPTSATVNQNGTTTLVWSLGTLTPNKTIGPFRIATHVDPFVNNNTSLTNSVNIKASGIAPVTLIHNDTHTITVTQPGSLQLKKSVDQVLDLQERDQAYTLQVKNFSENLSIQAPTIIDVLPYNGDRTNSAGVNRNPASDYAGSNTLRAAPTAFLFDGKTSAEGTFYYTSIDPSKVPQDLNADTDPAIWTTTFSSSATAFKFVAKNALGNMSTNEKSGLKITFTTDQKTNVAGDLYSNRFTAFSPTLMNGGKYQLLTSNQVMVRVVGFSLGDLVWFDTDNDGKFTFGVDETAPKGVSVRIYSKNGTLVPGGATTTNKDGRWVVNDLPEGDYYAVIPAAEFAAGGPLAGWTAQSVGYQADPNTDSNEETDNNGAVQKDGSVQTANIHLSAKVAGSVITGEEPLNDNVGNLPVTPGTTDGFTNFTLDMALRAVPGYEFTKTASPQSGSAVQAGDKITYTLAGKNTGNTVLDTVISDDLSKVLKFAELTAGPTAKIGDAAAKPEVDLTNTDLNWEGVLKPGEKITVTYTVTVSKGHEGATLENHASSSATPPYDPPITPPDVTTKHPVPGYAFSKQSDPESGTAVMPGSDVTYTLTGTNTGAMELGSVVVSDDLSKVLKHAEMKAAPVAMIGDAQAAVQPKVDGSDLNWNGRLDVGESVVITYTVTLHDDAAGVLINNHAESSATPPGLPPITPPPGETEHPTPKYEFAKSSDPKSGTAVQTGQVIEYTLTGTNSGRTVLDPVVISDDLAEVLKHVEMTVDPVASVEGVDDVPQPKRDGDSLTWAGVLQPGQVVKVTYSVQLKQGTEGVIVKNVASSSATPPGLPPLTPPDVETWHPTPGYTFMKSADPMTGSAVSPGDFITYTLTGTNAGKTNLNPVEVTDDLSGVLEFASLETAPVAQIVSGGEIREAAEKPALDGVKMTWNGSLDIGEQIVITYRVKVKAGAEGKTLHNRAVSVATPPGLLPITPPEVVTEHPVPGFLVAKVSDPRSGSTVTPGQTITYTVTGSNTGATVLEPALVTDDLAQVLNHAGMVGKPRAVVVDAEGASAPAAKPVLSGTKLSWTGTLEVGQRVEIRYSVKVAADAANVKIRNLAAGTATPPGLPPIVTPPAETTHTVPPADVTPPSVVEPPGETKHTVPPNNTKQPGLSVTGGQAVGGLAALGMILLAGGAMLVLGRRRKQRG